MQLWILTLAPTVARIAPPCSRCDTARHGTYQSRLRESYVRTEKAATHLHGRRVAIKCGIGDGDRDSTIFAIGINGATLQGGCSRFKTALKNALTPNAWFC